MFQNILFLASLASLAFSSLMKNESICIIQNLKYRSEYLHSSENEYDVYIDNEMSKLVYKRHKLVTNKLESNAIDSSLQLLWILKKVDWLNSTFYINNILWNNLYICSTHIHVDILYHRRRVMLNFVNKHSLITNKKCMWTLKHDPGESSNVYTIWNVYYKEPLYAATNMLKSVKSNSRNVYLWHERPDSKQFSWFINCV
jgi:hypothetical protein